jgi:hypothetical protein
MPRENVNMSEELETVTCSEGLIVRMSSYGDVDEARAAAERLAEERG